MAGSKNVLLRSKIRKAEQLLAAQRLPEARAAFEQLCQKNPHDYDLWLNLGIVSGRLGQIKVAEVALKKALALRSTEPHLYIKLMQLCELQGRFDEAVNYYQSYLCLKPKDADVYAQMGRLLHQLGRLPEAEQALREALRWSPDNANYANNLGITLYDLGRYDEALDAYQAALQLNPNMDDAYCNLGNLYQKTGETERAEASYFAALELNPMNVEVGKNLGILLLTAGRNDEAMRCFDARLRLVPDCADSHWNRALLLLAAGDFGAGWQEYEWRFRCEELKSEFLTARYSSKELWDGAQLCGKTLLIYAEQGLGDTLQFCRYLPLVMQRVEHLVFECQPELYRLLSGTYSGITLIQRHAEHLLPDVNYDFQVPLLTLPRLFDTVMESIPDTVPYINVDERLAEDWRQRIDRGRFNVGIVWAGNKNYKGDKERSLTLAALERLGEVENVCFYSLQKGPGAAEAVVAPAAMQLVDLASELDDFATTAAIIASLDLVITVDTAVAHLAGAMGRPVWTLIYSPPDWRWLLEREDSLWYPTMRLFRQGLPGEWEPVVEQVALALHQIVSTR